MGRVVLVLDHRERQTIAKMEAAGTVDLDSRGLSVADAIWCASPRFVEVSDLCRVARRLVPTGDPEADELVLDVAIERKRISDLVSSM
jgi:ERCC4-type nuclease